MANRSRAEGDLRIGLVDPGDRVNVAAWLYAQSPDVREIYAFPGNDGVKAEVTKPVHTFPGLKTTDVAEIVRLCLEHGINLVDVLQDNAIAAGLVNALNAVGIQTVGPTREAGEIESSKIWAREFGARNGLEQYQPLWQAFTSRETGIQYVMNHREQSYFIKGDGLAGGKAALAAEDIAAAVAAINDMIKFGEAGQKYLIEEWLGSKEGDTTQEFSIFALSDGSSYQLVGPAAQDHKRLLNGDKGPQTGGTGVSAPALAVTPEVMPQVHKILDKIFKGLKAENREYKGVLYLQCMVVRSADGKVEVKIVEENARWGNPEAQVLLPGMQNNWAEVGLAVAEGHLNKIELKHDGKARIGVVGMAQGYPNDYSHVTGKRIIGIDQARKVPGVQVFAGGVKVDSADGRYYANGGRLFTVVGEGTDVLEAQLAAYEAMGLISIEGKLLHYRTDIGIRDAHAFIQMLAGDSHS